MKNDYETSRNVYLSRKAWEKLNRYGDYNTNLYSYCLSSGKVYRIRLDALETMAARYDASYLHPDGWQRVNVLPMKGRD